MAASLEDLYGSLPLGPEDIRLLHLDAIECETHGLISGTFQSNQHNRSNLLRGRLTRTLLDNAPVFVAASYVWGEDHDDSEILVCKTDHGQCRIRLRSNCYTMLTQLRQRYGEITVWVDAICINQMDVEEKANQIKLMAKVYSQASFVVVWLGEGCEHSDRVMDSFASAWRFDASALANLKEGTILQWLASKLMRRYIFNLLYQRSWEFKGQGHSLQHTLMTVLLKRRHLRRHDICQDLESLLQNEWLTRSWTFQEFILARSPVLMCGNKVIGWPNFVFALGYIRLRGLSEDTPLPPSLTRWQSLAGLWATVDWYRRHRGSDEKITVWNASGHHDEDNLAEHSVPGLAWRRLKILVHRIWSLQKRWLVFAWHELIHISRRGWNVWQCAMSEAWYYARRTGNSAQYWILVSCAMMAAAIIQTCAVMVWIFGSMVALLAPWAVLVIAPLAVLIWVTVKYHIWWPIPLLGLFWAKLSLFPARIFIRDYKLSGHEPDRILNVNISRIPRPSPPVRRSPRPAPSRPPYPAPALHQPVPTRLFRAIQTPPDKVFKQGIVEAIRERKCSKPRDKAYALHNILQLAGIEHQDVDYERPLSEVHLNLLTGLLKFSPDFGVLLLDAGLHSSEVCVSWVPDWTNNGWRSWLDGAYLRFTNPCTATPGPVEVDGFTFDDQFELTLSGHWIDSCKQSYLSECRSDLEETAENEMLALQDWMRAALQSGQAAYETSENQIATHIFEAITGTVMLCTELIPDALMRLLRHIELYGNRTLPDNPLVLSWMRHSLSGLRATRSLFITREGRLGSGPLDMCQGDRIALINYVPVPLVFRETIEDGKYQLVGAAFVAGMMNGEAWNENVRCDRIHVV